MANSLIEFHSAEEEQEFLDWKAERRLGLREWNAEALLSGKRVTNSNFKVISGIQCGEGRSNTGSIPDRTAHPLHALMVDPIMQAVSRKSRIPCQISNAALSKSQGTNICKGEAVNVKECRPLNIEKLIDDEGIEVTNEATNELYNLQGKENTDPDLEEIMNSKALTSITQNNSRPKQILLQRKFFKNWSTKRVRYAIEQARVRLNFKSSSSITDDKCQSVRLRMLECLNSGCIEISADKNPAAMVGIWTLTVNYRWRQGNRWGKIGNLWLFLYETLNIE